MPSDLGQSIRWLREQNRRRGNDWWPEFFALLFVAYVLFWLGAYWGWF